MNTTHADLIAAETDLLVVAEGIRQAQMLANANRDACDGRATGVWGMLHTALVRTLVTYFRQQGATGALKLAKAVTDEIYDNGESVAYNVDIITNRWAIRRCATAGAR